MSFTTHSPTNEDDPQLPGNGQLMRSGGGAPMLSLQVTRSVRRRPALAIGVALAVLVAVVGYAFLQKSQYVASSQLYEVPTSSRLLGDGGAGSLDEGKYETFLSEQMLVVTRPDVLKAALESLPQGTWAEYGASEPAAADTLTTLLKIQRVGTSRQVSIGLKGSDPVKTAAVVNAVTTAYLEAVHKATVAESDQRGQLLTEERQRIESELQTARAEQIALGASIGVANPSVEGGNPYDAELSGIRVQLSEARAAHEVAAAQLASLSGIGPDGTSGLKAAADEQIMGDAGLSSMKASISQRKAQLTAQMAGMTPTNPVYKQSMDEIADLDRTLDKMMVDLRDKAARRIQDKLHSDLQRTGDVEARLNSELARQIESASSAAPKLQRASEVALDIQRLETRLAAVDEALRSLRMEASGPAQVRLSLAATPPDRPEANRRKQLLLLALPLAILFGVGATVLARIRDPRIYGGVDINDALSFPPMAVLPSRGEVAQRVFEEYVLRLAAAIESAHRNSGAKTFLLTAVSLTTDVRPLATALARKFEEIGFTVAVATASEMLAPTDELASSGEPAQGGEGFVAANVAKLKTGHGVVLIESEALLNCAQTEYVARCSDATILVAESGVTTRPELVSATELLHRLHVSNIGAVLEEVQLRNADPDLRKAIDALDRRQSESPRHDLRPASARPSARVSIDVPAPAEMQEPVPEPVQVALAAMAAAPQPEPTPRPEPQPQPELTAHPEPQPVPETLPPFSLLDVEGDRVELEYEPSHYHEVLHHVRATLPTEHDSGWHLPAFAQVPVQPHADAPAEYDFSGGHTLPDVSHADAPSILVQPPVNREVVENILPVVVPAAETPSLAASIAASNGSLHEKIAPTPWARREEPALNGDSGMNRKTSWLDKLLRRDSDPGFSIVPDDDDEAEELVEAPARIAVSASSSAAGAQAVSPQQAEARSNRGEDYDIPLANRLEQISGMRWAAQQGASARPAEPTPIRPSSRLRIVPQEPFVEEVQPEPDEPTPTLPEAAAHRLAEVEEIRRQPAPIEPVEQLVAAEPEPPVVAASAPAPPVQAKSPRRPLTFHELAGVTPQRQVSAEPAQVEAEPVEPARIEQAVEAIHPDELPVHDTPFEILAHLTEFKATPTEAPQVAEATSQIEAPSVIHHDIEEIVAESVAVAPPEPVLEKVEAVAEHTVVEPEPLPAVHPVAEPEPYFSLPSQPEPQPSEHGFAEFDAHQPSLFEADDIEPAYEEASRSLNTGRWDPIPTLRPSGIWRDRPSPVPPTNGNRAGARYTNGYGAAQDGFNAQPPRRWIPEAFVDVEPEPLPEPLLSRQWGLLSKFQQSRLVSSRPPVQPKGPADAGRDADEPGSESGFGNGNRQS